MRVCAFLFGIVSQEAAGALFLRVLDELPGRALLHHHAAVHEQDAVGHVTGKVHLVGHDNHGGLAVGQVPQNAQHLATAQRKDSQGICFVGKVDLPVFLQQQLKAREGAIVEIPASWPGYALRGRIAAPGERSTAWELPADGPFSQEQLDALAEPYRYTPEAGRQAGTHRGAHFFTIGQRKGLGVGGYAEPLFVIASDVEHNVLYVGMGQEHPGLYRRALRILPEEMHWIRPDRALQPGGSARFSMRIRYRQPLQGGVLHVTEQGGYIVFDRPQRGVTAGQFAAWYDGDELVGSGVIHR